MRAERPLWSATIFVLAFVASCAPTWRSTAGSPSRDSLFSYPWVWHSDRGDRVTLAQWRGAPIVLAALYTSCKETCPHTLAHLRQVYDQYTREHRRAEFVVITIDPETDTPERLREFRASKQLPDAWHLLTGDKRETEQLAEVMGIHLMEMGAHTVHDSKIVVFDGDGLSTSELDIM